MEKPYNSKNKKETIKVFKNYQIEAGNIRLISDFGSEIIDRDLAIDMAQDKNLSLIQISYDKSNRLPVCSICDYSKYVYDLKKKDKAKQKAIREAKADIKEVRFGITVDDNDFETKVRHIRKWLEKGDKVKITATLMRREAHKKDIALGLIERVLSEINDIADRDGKIVTTGNWQSIIVKSHNI